MPLKSDPEYAAAAAPMLQMMAAMPQPAIHDIQGRRQAIEGLGALMASMPISPEIEVKEYTIKSYDGAEIVVLHVRNGPESSTPQPALIHAHGGGMIAGSAKSFLPGVKANVALSGVQAFSVEYRLAPEFPHPTPSEDVYAALTWLHENAEKLKVDKARIGITGESAGGGLAAGVALMARDRKLQPPLAKQVLIYPMLDSRTVKPIPGLDEHLAVWSVESNITGWTAYVGDKLGKGDVSPYASPSHAKSLEGLPSTYIDVGSIDLFRDEDIAYGQRLSAANIDTEIHIYSGVPHGWELFAPQAAVTRGAMANRIRALKSF